MPSNRIKLEPNKPLIMALLDPFADSSERFDPELGVGEYRTTDGRILALPRQACVDLNALDPKPGEEIGVCRYTGRDARIAVWLAASSEKARAEQETAQDEAPAETPPPKPSRRVQTIRKLPVSEPQPRLFDQRGTGTDGPAPQLQPAAIAAPLLAQQKRPGDLIPWNVAFREVAKFVSAELKANDLQWSDEAQQAAVCTVLIAEVKKGRIGLWER